MEHPPKECVCPTKDSYDFSISEKEDEDLEEIDPEELVEDPATPHNIIWQDLCREFEASRKEIEDYKKATSTDCAVPLSKSFTYTNLILIPRYYKANLDPAVQFLEDEIFPLLINILENTINKANELEVIRHQKSAFNGIDFISEMLWNLNPRHPERKDNWTYIFDIDWVVTWLKNHPRPYYPFSWIWSKDYAATKIQAAIRGHRVRCRDDVQEMRQFWKLLAKEGTKETSSEQAPQ